MKQLTIMALIIGTMCSGITLVAQPYTPNAETILLYHFDESAGSGLPQDSSSYANNATSGQQATGDTGMFGNAVAFTNTFINIPDATSFDKAQTNGTIEFWTKFNTDALDYWGSESVLISKGTSGDNKGDFSIGYRMNPIANGGGLIYLFLETGAGYRMLRTPGFITDTSWHHVTVSWDSATKPTITVDDASQSLSDHGTDSSYVGPIFLSSGALTAGAGINFTKAPGGSILLDELRLVIPEPADTNKPAITYVVEPGTPGVTPMASYTNWATAATNIQDAIDAVEVNGTVLVSNGIYTLSATLEIANGITVRSYNGGSTDRSGTIINGNYPESTNRCISLSGVGTVIDGFTITNGYTSASSSQSGNGGGVYIDLYGTVTNCLIAGNEAGAGSGGGIYLYEGGLVTMCTISGNVATNANNAIAGGVFFYKAGVVTNCMVTGNIANKGAGVWFDGLSAPIGGLLIDSTVANNKAFVYASGQGAAGIGTYFKGIIDNCSVVSNTIVTFSGSGYNAGVQLSYYAVIRNSLIAYNTGGNYGGGVQVGKQGTASNCVIRNNSSNTGGGVYIGDLGLMQDCTVVSNSAAVFCQGGTVRNCLFADNNGGIWVQSSTTSFWQNCTVVNNGGTGMRFDVPASVDNCIVYDNGGANWSYNGAGTNTVWTSSCTTPALSGPNDTGNITDSPLFKNSSAGNYRLTRRSPCVNTGIDQLWMTGAVDLDGEPRIVGTAVDMGAYELPPLGGTCIIIQ